MDYSFISNNKLLYVAELASAQTLQEPDVSSLKDLLDTTTLEESSITATSSSSVQAEAVAQDTIQVSPPPGRCLSSSPIWAWHRLDWGFRFYNRIDLKGSFHTYPHVGGPFQSLQEAHSAIDRYLEDRRDPTMFMEQPGVSRVDKAVRQCLHWPDGTRKKRLKSQPIDERHDWTRQLVQALVDKYNDYHNLLGDLAYELKDVVCCQSVRVGNGYSRSYYHINFTTKTKGADHSNCGIDDLFFAEVTFIPGEYAELVVSCFCLVKPTDNGHCYGCNAKHPNDADAYTGGQFNALGACFPLAGANIEWRGYDEDLEAEEDRVRRFYEQQGLDDPGHEEEVKKLMKLEPFRPNYLGVKATEED